MDRLKAESEKLDGHKPFEDLMEGLSDGSIDFKWAFGGRLLPHQEPLEKPDMIWLRYLISTPFIFAMFIPTSILDICVTLYQNICFRLWKIPLVSRREYLVIDRHKLSYLTWIEKFNCIYCGYTNGVYAYAKTVAGESERFWCPVKHEEQVPSPHKFYLEFADFDEPEKWENHIEQRAQKIRE